MTTFRVVIDRSLCSGFGSCVDLAPTLFALDGEGIATARTGETEDESAIAAAGDCPMGAISVFDAATGHQFA